MINGMSQKHYSNRESISHNDHKSTTEKQRVVSTHTSDYHRLLDEDFARRKTFNSCKGDTQLKQIPILRAQNQERLDLSHNLIRKIENLQGMKKLKVLNISHNRIITIEGIFTLRRLEELNLSHNSISQLPRDFRWMTSLKSLFLNHNKISQLESLDSISCLQLVKLDIENNYVCRVPGFRRYVQTHFKWLESLDRKSISHRNLQNDMYETPIESIHEDRGINEQIRTCQRQPDKNQPQQDHNKTHKRDDKEQCSQKKPQLTEIKPIRTERLNKDVEIMSYKEYLRKQHNTKPITNPCLLNEQKKLADGKMRLINMLAEQKHSVIQNIEVYTGIIQEYRHMRNIDQKLLSQLQQYTASNQNKMISKFCELIGTMDDFFECERENLNILSQYLSINTVMDGSSDAITNNLTKTIKLRPCSHDETSTRLIKSINFTSLELLNIENQQFLEGTTSNTNTIKQISECKQRIRDYAKLYNKSHKQRLNVMIMWKDYSLTAGRLVQISYMVISGSLASSPKAESPNREQMQSSGLKKILFSDRAPDLNGSEVKHTDLEEIKQLQEKLAVESQKCRNLQEQLLKLSKAKFEMQKQFDDERQERLESEHMLQQQISLLNTEKSTYKEKWQSVELFHNDNSKLYQELLKKQGNLLGLMRDKLTGDFFQQIIMSQAQSIEQLLKASNQLQAKYIIEVKRDISSSRFDNTLKIKHSKERGCSKTQNTRYPNSNKVVGIESSESNLLEYSEQRDQQPSRGHKNISEFIINTGQRDSIKLKESAKFKESLSFHSLNRDRQLTGTDYFRKSSGFSFKKSSKNLLSSSKSKAIPHHLITDMNESETKHNMMESYSNHRHDKENNNPNLPKYYTAKEQINQRKKEYSEVQLEPTDNYKNYLKYYLRNNIIEVLSKGDLHPHLRQRFSKEQIMHKKYHSFTGPRLIKNGKTTRSMERVFRC